MFNLLPFSFNTLSFEDLVDPHLPSELYGHCPPFYFLLVGLQGSDDFLKKHFLRGAFSFCFCYSMHNFTLVLQFK